jgi:uncharacterized protein (DUF2141 family)
MTSKVRSAAATFCLSIAAMAGGPGATAMAQQPTAKASLTVELIGFADTTGNATVCLFASEDAFKSVDLRKDRKDYQQFLHSVQDVPIQRAGNGLIAFSRIENLQPGEYVAVAFHDRNQNGKIDSNFLGVPTEPFGFSNDVRPQMLPIPRTPTWRATAFVVQPGENRIRIQVRN